MRKNGKEGEKAMFFLPTNINIQTLKLNNVDHLSSVSFSSTIKQNRNVNAKKSQGFGQQLADGVNRVSSVTYVIDDEPIDSISIKRK